MAGLLEEITGALRGGVSGDVALVRASEARLESLSKQPGFYGVLSVVLTDRSVEANARWLGMLFIKVASEKQWRHFQLKALKVEEKDRIKAALLSLIDEPSPQIFSQMLVCVGNIYRIDFQGSWNEIIPTLMNAATSGSPFLEERGLALLSRCLKSLCSIPRGKEALLNMCPMLFDALHAHWLGHLNAFASAQSLDSPHLARANGFLKPLRTLFAYGINSKSSFSASMLSFPQSVIDLSRIVVSLVAATPQPLGMRTLKLLGKTFLGYFEHRPYHFVMDASFPAFVEFALQFIEAQAPLQQRSRALEPLLIQVLLLVKQLVKHSAFNRPEMDDFARAADERLGRFWTDERVRALAQLLLRYYLTLGPNDLTLWEEDAEEFAAADDSEAWRVLLRPCCELLFASMASKFRAIVAPMVIEMLRTVTSVPAASLSTDDLFQRDAIYAAVQMGSYDLYDFMDFDALLANTLVHDVAAAHPWAKVLRRRVALLIGAWVTVKLSVSVRPIAYRILVSLLASSEDVLVRASAARAMMACIDDYEFEEAPFVEFAGPTLLLCGDLVTRSRSFEVETYALNCMSALMARMPGHLVERVGDIETLVARVWAHAGQGDSDILKIGLIVFLTRSVEALKWHSARLMPFITACVQQAVMGGVDGTLVEDALLLLLAAVRNAQALTPDVVGLLHVVLALLETGGEAFERSLEIVTSYLLFGDQAFVMVHGPAIAQALRERIRSDASSDSLSRVLGVVSIAVQTFPDAAQPLLFDSVLASALLLFEEGVTDTGILFPAVFDVLARFTLRHGAIQLASLLRARSADAVGRYIKCFVQSWSMVSSLGHQKTLCAQIGLLLIANGSIPELHEGSHIAQLVAVGIKFAERLRDDGGDEDITDASAFDDEVVQYEVADSLEESRRRALRRSDYSNWVSGATHLKRALEQCAANEPNNAQWRTWLKTIPLYASDA